MIRHDKSIIEAGKIILIKLYPGRKRTIKEPKIFRTKNNGELLSEIVNIVKMKSIDNILFNQNQYESDESANVIMLSGLFGGGCIKSTSFSSYR